MRHRPPMNADARLIEELLGLERFSLRGVERRANGDFAVTFRTQRLGNGYPRVLRIPAKRVLGYCQRSPTARPSDVAARRKASDRRFAYWLMSRVGHDAPVVRRAVFARDLAAVDELREAILALAPIFVLIAVAGPARPDEPLYVPEEWQ